MSSSDENSKKRPLRLKSAWGDDVILVQVSGSEEISQCFRFRLSFVSESDTLDFSTLLGTSATVYVDLPSGESRKWNGVITSLHQAGRDEEFCHYSATLEPTFALFRLQNDYRIFQDKTTKAILTEVFGDLSVDIQLTRSEATDDADSDTNCYRPRNYCVQYGETDLAFAMRLMEEEGIFFYFTHTDDSHTLCLRDDSTQLKDFDSQDEVAYTKLDGGVQDDACISKWEKTQHVVSTTVLMRDAHFQDTGNTFDATESLTKDNKVSIGTVEHVLNPTGATKQLTWFPSEIAAWADNIAGDNSTRKQVDKIADVAKLGAKREITSLQNSALEIAAASNLLLLHAGGNFTMKGHFNSDGTYLITRLDHQIDLGIGKQSAADDSPLQYSNSFSCMPAKLSFVPLRRSGKPVVSSIQTAYVVAPTGTQQMYDSYGRVKVWFPWDRREGPTYQPPNEEPSDDDNEKQTATKQASERSCWIRVGQIWAGAGWGAYFWPRAGNEVLVAFEHGDPDRPVIVGSVYNNKNLPPIDMPAQAELGGIRSCSVKGNPAVNFNGITFHDQLDNEHLELHSESHSINCSEESSHSFVRGTAVRVFGTMYSGLTSGGGGGPEAAESTEQKPADQSDENSSDQSSGELVNALGQKWQKWKKWAAKWQGARLEADIQVILGHSANIVGGFPLGTSSEVVQGGKLGVTLDPSAWISDDTVQQIQDLIVPLGESNGLFGSGRSLHYGPATTIRHGTEIVRRSSQPFDASNPRTAWVAGIATVATSLTLLGWRLQKDDSTVWESLVRSLGPRGATGILFNLLLEYEKACGECDAGSETQNEASSITTQVKSLDSDYQSLLIDFASSITDRGTALSTAGESDKSKANSDAGKVGDVTSFADSTEEAGEDGDENEEASSDDSTADTGPSDDSNGTVSPNDVSFGPDEANVYQAYDGLLSTSARHLSFRARATDSDDTDASLIHLDAQGGDGEDNGVVAINSTGQATMVCGPASLQMRRSSDTGQISMRTGDQGSIKLASGPSSSGSNGTLDPDKIKFNIGGDSGSTVEMTSDGIKLSFGGGASPSFELNSSGITMTCGGSKFVLASSEQTTTSESITHQASASLTQKGGMLDLEASGVTTLKGSMVQIN